MKKRPRVGLHPMKKETDPLLHIVRDQRIIFFKECHRVPPQNFFFG
jgi:hypothetical protein